MIVSKYTFFVESRNHFYIYNSLSNALLEIEKNDYDSLWSAKITGKQVQVENFETELQSALRINNIIVDNHRDELLIYKSLVHGIREQTNFMHLTIAPTTDCNFHCFYCFEKEKKPLYMKESVMDSIVKYISSIHSLQNVKLTWFGGEPLMAKKEIRNLYTKLSSIPNINIISSNIITTGYYLDTETIELFREVNITDAQITLDGNEASHNKIKIDNNCPNVFEKVINNVKLLTDKYPDFHITFRVNLTKHNANEYAELHKYLLTMFEGKNVGVSPAFVSDRSPKSKGKTAEYLFNNDEAGNFIINLITQYGIPTVFSCYPDQQICECAVRDKMAISFDPLGYAYKCWERIGEHKYAIGKLNQEGVLTEVNNIELARELYGADPLENKECCDCSYLPICHGGCPIKRIQNEFDGYENELCTLKKGKMDKFIKIHLRLSELGINNKL